MIAGSTISNIPADRRVIVWIMLAALVLRLFLAWLFPNLVHYDEIHQVTEQAFSFYQQNRIIPWEFREGIRGWLWPMMIAAIAWPGEKLIGTGAAFAASIVVFMCLLSLLTVWGAWAIGRLKSPVHGLIGALAAAVWFEFVYYSPHPLSEVAATAFLVPGLYFLMAGGSSWRFALAGVLLGMAFVLRIQLAPALAFAVLYGCRLEFRARWLPLVAGGLLPLAAYGAADITMYGMPFKSMYAYFAINFLQDKASHYGVHPFYHYVTMLAGIWSFFLPVILGLLLLTRKPFMLLIYVAGLIVLSHSFIGHKELRFIYPASMLIVLAAVYASIEAAAWFQKRFSAFTGLQAATLALIMWVAISPILAAMPVFSTAWTLQRAPLKAFRWIARQPDVCGVGLYRVNWFSTPGLSAIHKDVGLYLEGPAAARLREVALDLSHAYNYAAADSRDRLPEPFSQKVCFEGTGTPPVCVWRREGACKPDPARHINEALKRSGQ